MPPISILRNQMRQYPLKSINAPLTTPGEIANPVRFKSKIFSRKDSRKKEVLEKSFKIDYHLLAVDVGDVLNR